MIQLAHGRAAFLDRDGVINRDHGYVHRVEDLQLLPGALQGLRLLQDAGFALIVVTNQSGIARGLYTEADFGAFQAALAAQLALGGVALTATYFCPHLDTAALAPDAVACDCRKPRPGMIVRGLREQGAVARKSFIVGDKASDVGAGRAAGLARCYLAGAGTIDASVSADGTFPGLLACARHVVAHPFSD